MLTANSAEKGLNFLSKELFELAENRLSEKRGGVEPFRLLRNMLSSQPMCFNLFGALILNPDHSTKLVRSIWGPDIEKVKSVKFEWAPQPRSEYLDDGTSFDAFIEYESSTGLGFIGIETKLSENIASKRIVKSQYKDWMKEKGPWKHDAYPRCSERKYNQLWRNHLLAWALINHGTSKYTRGCLTVVHHQDDARCQKAVDDYRTFLKDTNTFKPVCLHEFVSAWFNVLPDWAEKFKLRYLDLDSHSDQK